MSKRDTDLGEIVVFVDGTTATSGILEFAGGLAQEHSTHLIAVFMQPQPAVTPSEMFARGKAIRTVIETHRAELKAIEADHPALSSPPAGRSLCSRHAAERRGCAAS